jgi:hypothetical protein
MYTLSTRTLSALAYERGEEYERWATGERLDPIEQRVVDLAVTLRVGAPRIEHAKGATGRRRQAVAIGGELRVQTGYSPRAQRVSGAAYSLKLAC